MVLPDRQTILGFDAFLRDAGPDDFREAVKVERIDAHAAFDFGPQRCQMRAGCHFQVSIAAVRMLDPVQRRAAHAPVHDHHVACP